MAVHPLLMPIQTCRHNASSGQVIPRRPRKSTYRCFLPDLTGFAAPRRVRPNHQHRVALAVSEPSTESRSSAPL